LKAITYTEYGSPDVLKLEEVEKPTPKDNEVLIKVFAVSLNDWDLDLLKGSSFVTRLSFGFKKPIKSILGSDVAGIIEAVGKDVTKFKQGDEVYGDLSGDWGGFAEYVCARENQLSIKPSSMTFEEAAAIPQAAMLAIQGLYDKGKIQSGQKILINGAGGGVGTFAIQIAKLYDAEVTGVDNTGKLDMLRSLGFDHVIDYTQEDFTKNKQHYDLILDVKTNRSIFKYTRKLLPNGTYVTVGGKLGKLLQAFLLGQIISKFSHKKVCVVDLKPNKDLAYMNELFEAGKIKPIIHETYKLEEVPEAFRILSKGVHNGKIVITI
jgi:NADPH:quinone reductase-like Zn-dependent oxidoreductase